MGISSSLQDQMRHNIRTLLSSPLSELSGALGDLGTLLPLMIGLALSGSISLSATLILTGLFNIVTGSVFGVPIPVQPMKAIAAAAIASNTSISQTVAAGALVGATVFLLGTTGAISLAVRWIPVPVIKGIQVGAGLSLCATSGRLIQELGWVSPALDNRIWAAVFFVLLLATQVEPWYQNAGKTRRGISSNFPYALVVFLLGIIFAIMAILTPLQSGNRHEQEEHLPGPGIWVPSFVIPDFGPGALGMAAAQLPLTLLNSVLAVSALSTDLLPEVPAPAPAAMAVSVGLMNLAGCWLGSMPVCHGSGGLAAQYKFGARSGGSIILLGLLKLVVGLVFGDSVMGLLRKFPHGVLGVMVLAAGLELAGVGESLNSSSSADLSGAEDGSVRDETSGLLHTTKLGSKERKRRWSIMLVTASGSVGFRNAGIGFVAGMLCHWSYRIRDWIAQREDERAPLLSGCRS